MILLVLGDGGVGTKVTDADVGGGIGSMVKGTSIGGGVSSMVP